MKILATLVSDVGWSSKNLCVNVMIGSIDHEIRGVIKSLPTTGMNGFVL